MQQASGEETGAHAHTPLDWHGFAATVWNVTPDWMDRPLGVFE